MLQKLLLLAIAIAVVLYGFRVFARIGRQRNQTLEREEDAARVAVAETVQCPVCKAYIAEDVKGNCGKPNCPY